MTAPTIEHKIHRSCSVGVFRAECVCGWSIEDRRSNVVSLACAAHRNLHGLNRRMAVSP